MAWGRLAELPGDLAQALKNKAEGGTGVAELFFKFCDREVESFRD